MEDASTSAAADSGCSTKSSNEPTTTTGGNLANPEISCPTSSTKPQPWRRRREPLEPVGTKWNALIFLSLPVALFILAKVWLYCDRPLPVALVWEISLLISLLSLPWVSFLKVTTRTHMVFLLSVITHLALSPKVGMLAVRLTTHAAAGFLGYALAEHRLHEATERFDVPMPTNKEQAERLRSLRIAVGLYCSLITVGAAVGVAWVVRHADEYSTSELLLNILMPLPSILALWISFVAALLRGALMGHGGLGLVYSYFGLVAMVLVLSLATLGYAAAAINVWFTVLGLSGFFGYSLSVYDSYKGVLGKTTWDDKESDLKESSPSSAESDKLLQSTPEKSRWEQQQR